LGIGRLLGALANGNIDFILVGGVAGAAHGAARATYDVDVVYSRTAENIERLVATLAPLQPYLRGAPPGLPFSWDALTVTAGLNFTLTTAVGDLDLLGQIVGGGSYQDLIAHTQRIHVFDIDCLVITLDKLIAVKRAAGRQKDIEAIAELEVIAEERNRRLP
jgi:hypothetical protein